MEYEFADRTVEYVDAKAIRSFWALKEGHLYFLAR